MKLLRAQYFVEGKCIHAEGMMRNKCIGGTATLLLNVAADEDTFKTRTGPIAVDAELTALKNPEGESVIDKIPSESRSVRSQKHQLAGGKISVDLSLMDGGVLVHINANLSSDGTLLQNGTVGCEIKKWTWRLMLKTVTATFTGKRASLQEAVISQT
jgi:hypothetical protein